MELSNKIKLSKFIIDDKSHRYCELYRIVNIENGKKYIGQSVSHILNHNRYRPYGKEGRFRCHISEAYSNKKNQSHYLNNAIRKYGALSFEIEHIEYCDIENADEREGYHILNENSIYPNGYNLKIGGRQFQHTTESKERVSRGIVNYYEKQKLERFKDIGIIEEPFEQYIRPLKRHNVQYGWYVYIHHKKADFGGVHISLEDSKNMAVNFIQTLKEKQMATHLDAGNSL